MTLISFIFIQLLFVSSIFLCIQIIYAIMSGWDNFFNVFDNEANQGSYDNNEAGLGGTQPYRWVWLASSRESSWFGLMVWVRDPMERVVMRRETMEREARGREMEATEREATERGSVMLAIDHR
ncbi:hypothetical protein HanIR_Chr11g0505911 [Helianthus annuus]|nr:hypothetical protein HanIR_Chr11g0505911 [Helianthus annuus]